jgi:Tfp pilus assembly protein PilW
LRTAWLHHRHALQGRTLIELMVAITAGVIILGATMASVISVQRLYAAVEDYSMDEGSQLLISDYISMDLRRCSDVTAVNNVLTITIPDYYGNGGTKPSSNAVANNPMVVGNNVSYGSTNVTVKYYLQGSSFIREVNGTQNAVTVNVSDFTVTDQDLTTAVTCTTTFQPGFTTAATANEVAGTKVYTNVYLRNAVAHH